MHSALAAMDVNALSLAVAQLAGSHSGFSIDRVCASRHGAQRDASCRTYLGRAVWQIAGVSTVAREAPLTHGRAAVGKLTDAGQPVENVGTANG